MAASRLGQFYEGFASYRRMLAKAAGEAQPTIFSNCVAEVTGYIAKGLDRVVAADELADMAASIGWQPDDAQQIISRQFARVERSNGPDADPNGFDDDDDGDPDQVVGYPDIDLNRDYGGDGQQPRAARPSRRNGREEPAQQQPAIPLQSLAAFITDLTSPEYLVENLLQRRFLYALTGKTGSGKTAIALYIAACVALGRPIGALEVMQGRVLYLAGENADDVRYRLMAMSQQMEFGFDLPILISPRRVPLSQAWASLVEQVRAIGDLALVVVDTSAAYFEGDEVNSNTQQGEHARMLRGLIGLPGGPAVIVNCHPVKNAAKDNLLPLGAGAFLNEVDANLTVWIEGNAAELYWQGKIRGQDFAPINFELCTVGHERLVTAAGKPMKTVVARYLSDAAQEGREQAAIGDAELLLADVERYPKAPQRDRAGHLTWLFASGTPDHPKVGRLLKRLKNDRLVTKELGLWKLTEKGKKHLLQSAPSDLEQN